MESSQVFVGHCNSFTKISRKL